MISPIPFIKSFFPLNLPNFQLLVNFLIKLGISKFELANIGFQINGNLALDFNADLVLSLEPWLAQVTLPNFQVQIPIRGISIPKFTALVDWKLGSFRLQGISFIVKGSIPQLKWFAPTLNIGDFLLNLKLSLLPLPLLPTLRAHFLDIGFKNLSITLTFPEFPSKFDLRLKGLAFFNNLCVQTEGLVRKVKSGYAFALGVVVKDTSVAELLSKLFNIKLLESVPFFKSRFTVGIIVSNVAITNVQFEYKLLNQLRVISGLSLIAPFKLPSDCAVNPLCEFAKLALKGDLVLTTYVGSLEQIVLTVPLKDIFLPLGLTLTQVSLVYKVDGPNSATPQNSIGISAELEIVIIDARLRFKGSIRQAVNRVEFDMKTTEWWEKAFSVPFLSIGNGLLELGYDPKIQSVTLLRIIADVKIGKVNNGKEIRGRIDLRLDFETSNRQYFCGNVSKFTWGSLLNAFDVTLPLPQIITDIGFRDGFQVSYSSYSTPVYISQIPNGNNKIIPPGFSFSGKMNYLGLEFSLNVTITPNCLLLEACTARPIEIPFGLIRICRSTIRQDEGPCLKLKLCFNGNSDYKVVLEGHISLFGGTLKRPINITIANNEIKTEFTDKLYGFNLKIEITGAYGNLAESKFDVTVHVTTDILQNIGREITDKIRSAASKATGAVNVLRNKLNKARAAFDAANGFLSARQRDLDSAQRVFDNAKRVFDVAQRKVNSLCSIRSCSQRKSLSNVSSPFHPNYFSYCSMRWLSRL